MKRNSYMEQKFTQRKYLSKKVNRAMKQFIILVNLIQANLQDFCKKRIL